MRVTKNFISFFKDNPPSFAKDDSTSMRVNGKHFDYADLAKMEKLFSPEVVLEYELGEWYKLSSSDKLTFLKNFIEDKFRQGRKERLLKKEALNSAIKESDLKLPDTDYIIHNLQPCRVVGDNRRDAGYRFIDRKSGELTNYDYYSIFVAMTRHIDEKDVKRFMSNIAHVTLEYNPYEDYKLKLIEGSNNLYSVNSYRRPQWFFNIENPVPTYDEDIKKLIEHLFPIEEDREFVFNWMYHSLTKRAGTYLYLCGGQGSGKNTFAKLLIKMHGENNSSSPKQDSLKNRFNQYLKNKRFIFFDEFNCRKRVDKDYLKSIINDTVQVEGKGVDQEDIDVYCSYVIANNSMEAIQLDPVDRRFSVPNITDVPIIDVYGRKWMRELVKKLESDEVIANFTAYVLEKYNEPKYFDDEPYQTERFDRIVMSTARLGYQYTLEKIFNKDQVEFDYYSEKERYSALHKNKAPFPSFIDWINFFKEFKYEGEKVASVVEGKVIPVDKYIYKSDCDPI